MPRIAVTTLGENCSLALYHQATRLRQYETDISDCVWLLR
jgi:hypothetical protein